MKILLRVLLTTSISCILNCVSIAQDVVYKQDGTMLSVKVTEIGTENILYTNQGSDTEIMIPKSEVVKIKYKNGKEENISPQRPNVQRQVQEKPIQNVSAIQPKPEPDKLIIIDYEKKRGFIGLYLGGSVPLGDLGSNLFSNQQSIYALTGVNIKIEGGYWFLKYIGVSSKIISSAYVRNDERIKKLYDSFVSEDGSIYGTNSKVTSEPISFSALMLGVRFCLPYRRFSAELGLNGGFSVNTLGVVSINQELYDANNIYINNLIYSFPELSSGGFVRSIDLGFKFDVHPRIYLGFQMEIMGQKLEFEKHFVKRDFEFSDDFDDEFPVEKSTVTWRSFNSSFGIGYIFR